MMAIESGTAVQHCPSYSVAMPRYSHFELLLPPEVRRVTLPVLHELLGAAFCIPIPNLLKRLKMNHRIHLYCAAYVIQSAHTACVRLATRFGHSL